MQRPRFAGAEIMLYYCKDKGKNTPFTFLVFFPFPRMWSDTSFVEKIGSTAIA